MTLRHLLCRKIINYDDAVNISGPNIEDYTGRVIDADPIVRDFRIKSLEENFGCYTIQLDGLSPRPSYRDGDCPFNTSVVNQITYTPINVSKFFELYDKLSPRHNSTHYDLVRRVRLFVDITEDKAYYSSVKDLPDFLKLGYVELIDCEGTFYIYGVSRLREDTRNDE